MLIVRRLAAFCWRGADDTALRRLRAQYHPGRPTLIGPHFTLIFGAEGQRGRRRLGDAAGCLPAPSGFSDVARMIASLSDTTALCRLASRCLPSSRTPARWRRGLDQATRGRPTPRQCRDIVRDRISRSVLARSRRDRRAGKASSSSVNTALAPWQVEEPALLLRRGGDRLRRFGRSAAGAVVISSEAFAAAHRT